MWKKEPVPSLLIGDNFPDPPFGQTLWPKQVFLFLISPCSHNLLSSFQASSIHADVWTLGSLPVSHADVKFQIGPTESLQRKPTGWSAHSSTLNIHIPSLLFQATEHCPFYSDDKEIPDAFDDQEKSGVSCFAEFFFISATVLFRIASICLLLWVFMVHHL